MGKQENLLVPLEMEIACLGCSRIIRRDLRLRDGEACKARYVHVLIGEINALTLGHGRLPAATV